MTVHGYLIGEGGLEGAEQKSISIVERNTETTEKGKKKKAGYA